MGTSIVAGLDIPLGEDLKVGDGLAGHSRLGGLCGGETEAKEGGSLPGPPSRAESRVGHRECKGDRQQ